VGRQAREKVGVFGLTFTIDRVDFHEHVYCHYIVLLSLRLLFLCVVFVYNDLHFLPKERYTFNVKPSVRPLETGTERDSIGLWSNRARPLGLA
jgi:hypothetical protein